MFTTFEAVEEVFAELAGGPLGRELPVRRRDDPHVDLHRLVASDALERALLQEAQELDLDRREISPISSRKEGAAVGLLEAPSRRPSAPVNAPRSCPNSSLSRSVSASAAQWSFTNGALARGLFWWIAWATAPCPCRFSPVMSTLAFDGATCSMTLKTSCITGLEPMMLSKLRRSVSAREARSPRDGASVARERGR